MAKNPKPAPETPPADSPESNKRSNLVWMDMEMTGVDLPDHVILEIATIVTDNELNILAEGPVIAVHQDDESLAAMDDWARYHHARSGLLDRVRASEISVADAEQQTIDFLSAWIEPYQSPLCGNSIAQDRRFLRRYMSRLESMFHYRNIDVSTIKELVARWYGEESLPPKVKTHLALDDIRGSISELRWYREHIFRDPR